MQSLKKILGLAAGMLLIGASGAVQAAEIERVYGPNAMSPIAAGVSVPRAIPPFTFPEPCPRR